MKRQYFGTDGVRGLYGGPIINETFAEKLGYAVAHWIKVKGRVLIGRDTRASGAALERAIARGLRQGGLQPFSLGVLPTPAVARAVVKQQAGLGVVLTASHNPGRDNGIKFFGATGVKLTDHDEAEIEAMLPVTLERSGGEEPVPSLSGAIDDYIAVAQSLLAPRQLAGWKVVLDTANGATCVTSPAVFRSLGAEVIAVGDAPTGDNINEGVGSEHPERLAALVRKTGARIGVAHDGDGDRCVLCDEKGDILDGDEILSILGIFALARGSLVRNTMVVTVQSNLGVDAAIVQAGGRVCRTAVGDRYVVERMLAEGAFLGGESSGHVICAEISPTGDGLVAALKVIEVMVATGKPLSELRRCLQKFPQLTRALHVKEKRPLESLPLVSLAIRALEAELGSKGRVLVRYSGTESKLRLLVEGASEAIVTDGIARLESAVRKELDVI